MNSPYLLLNDIEVEQPGAVLHVIPQPIWCRICMNDEETIGELIRPCDCNAIVHRQCLDIWRRSDLRRVQTCEVCRKNYEPEDGEQVTPLKKPFVHVLFAVLKEVIVLFLILEGIAMIIYSLLMIADTTATMIVESIPWEYIHENEEIQPHSFTYLEQMFLLNSMSFFVIGASRCCLWMAQNRCFAGIIVFGLTDKSNRHTVIAQIVWVLILIILFIGVVYSGKVLLERMYGKIQSRIIQQNGQNGNPIWRVQNNHSRHPEV